MSSEWYSGKLGDVIELKRGYDLPQAKRNKGVVPLVSSSGVSDSHNTAMVKGPGVVTGRYGTIGQVFYVEDDFWPLNTTLYVRDFKGNHPKFVHYFLKTLDFLAYSDKAAVPGVNRNHLHEASVLMPPVTEQKEIASFLGALDDRITLLRETNATLEAIAQALFKSWFVDFDPVRAKAEGRARQDGERSGQPRMPQASELPRPGAEAGAEAQGQPEGAIQGSMSAAEGRMPKAAMDAATAALFPDSFEESELGLVPKGWAVRSLDSIADYLNGLALQKFPPSEDSWLPVIKIAQLRKGDTVGADRAGRNIKPEYVIQNGDVLFSWSGSLEVVIWCGGEGALNQHLFKVTSTEFPKWFYYLWTRHHLPDFQQTAASKATTMGHIQRKHLTEAKVVVPPAEVIQEAGSFIAPLLDRWLSNAEQVQTLTQLRDTLLPRLISGQLRLPELTLTKSTYAD